MVINPGDVWIIEEPTWPYSCDTTSLDNGNPLAVTTINMPTGNFVDEALVIAGFTVDVNGNESPDGDAPIREDWVFGAEGLSKVAGLVFQMQGTLGVESNAAQPLYLNRPVTVGDVKAYVQAAPTGSGDHVHDLRRRRGLADPDYCRRPDCGGRNAVPDRRFVADPGQYGGLDWHHCGGHNVPRREPLGVHLLVKWIRFTNCSRIARWHCRALTTTARRRHCGARPTPGSPCPACSATWPISPCWSCSRKTIRSATRCSPIFRTAISPASYSISTSHGRAFNPGNRSRTRGRIGTRSTTPSTASATTDVKWIGTPGITITCNTTGRAGASATFTLNLNQPAGWRQGHAVVSEPVVHQPGDHSRQSDHRPGSVVAGIGGDYRPSAVVAGERGL